MNVKLIVEKANQSWRNRPRKRGKVNPLKLSRRFHLYAPPAPDGRKGNYDWIDPLKCSLDGETLGTTKCFEYLWPRPTALEKTTDVGYSNPIHMRKRSCWCSNCLQRQWNHCLFSGVVGPHSAASTMWPYRLRNQKRWVETKMKQVLSRTQKIEPRFELP